MGERPRLDLVHAPTPIATRPALDAMLGAEIFVKRDDMTGGAEAGNKLRKLEFLLADAIAQRKTTIITCGGIQSNHARATALTCAALGLRCVLYLRVPDPDATDVGVAGNVLLDRLAGAEIRLVSPEQYRDRNAIMGRARVELDAAYVVPEGGSNGLGALGYVEAMREVARQIDLGVLGQGAPFDVVAHACGSGGTAAGVALGAQRYGVARETWAFAVCDDAGTFRRTISRIAIEARDLRPDLPELAFVGPGEGAQVAPDRAARIVVDDRAKGPAYAVMTDEQKRFLVAVTRRSGLVLDPVYTGKAFFGLAAAIERGEIRRGSRVLFLHTGGLPGLLAQGAELRSALEEVR